MTAERYGLTLTRLAALGTLSRSAGEGGPSALGSVGEGICQPRSSVLRRG
jgi:hypothetical protein